MKKIPIMFQLFLILFSILVIPTIILTYYTTSKMVKYSQEEIANSAISELEANRDMSENIMYGIVQDVLRMVVTNDFNIVKDIPSFEIMNKNITNIKKARELREQLNSMLYNDGIIHSIYFYLDDSDYVISTDKGITKLPDYESIDWMKEAIKGKASGVGFWCPRELNLSSVNEVESRKNNAISLNVISYVYRLSTLTTSTKGTVVVNVREDGLNEFMDQENDNEASESYLIEKSGRIIGAKEKELFLTDGSSNPIIAYVLKSNSPYGYGYYEDANGKMLYTYVTMDTEGWIYLKMTSLDFLMGKTNQLRMNVIFVTVIIILCGTIATVLLATRISKPMRDLVARLKQKEGLNFTANKNELAFIDSAFREIQEQEDSLYKMLHDREKDSKGLIVRKLLNGEIDQDDEREIKQVFPYSKYMVCIIAIDRNTKYREQMNAETRSYHRYILNTLCEEVFQDGIKAECTRMSPGKQAVIINGDHFDKSEICKKITLGMEDIRKRCKEIFGHTVTIGVSCFHEGYPNIKDCVFEASEAIKMRLLKGGNCVISYKVPESDMKKYFYPYNSEKKILNYINTCDLEDIRNELKVIHEEILISQEEVTYENIMLIYNQLICSTLKYMTEHNINTGKAFIDANKIYSDMMSLDTLNEVEEYMVEFYKIILSCMTLESDSNEKKYGDQILEYINKHYKEDIMFEEMADEIGISYSYMRKLVKNITGKSLIDYINILRIEEVKRLLLYSDMSITQIALEVGYRNVQSVNRFFKKYEGISPSEYKSVSH